MTTREARWKYCFFSFLFLVLFPCSFRNLPTRVVVSEVVNVISFYLKKTGYG